MSSTSSNSSSSDGVGTKVEWGFLARVSHWFLHETLGGITSLLILFCIVVGLGRVIPTYKVSHTVIRPPLMLYEGDLYTLDDNILGIPRDVITMTLTSPQPFSLVLDQGLKSQEVVAQKFFDQKYWIKNQEVRNLGFRITKANAPVRLYEYSDGKDRAVSYTLETTHGYSIVEKTWWFVLSWIVRGVIIFMFLGAFFSWLDGTL